MRYNGQIDNWNDERGFGFVVVSGTGERHFVHVKSFEQRQQRPQNGDWVTFELAAQRDRAARAVKVRPAAQRRNTAGAARPDTRRRFAIDWLLAGALCAALGWEVLRNLVPPAALALAATGSLIAFVMFNVDKRRAEKNQRRTPETTLLAISLIGWPGALAAQQLFRHKSSKRSFYYPFRALALMQLGVFGWIAHMHSGV